MKYERVPMKAIHPIIKTWITKYMGTIDYFIIDCIFNEDNQNFEYLIVHANPTRFEPARHFHPFRIIVTPTVDGAYSIRKTVKPFRRNSLTND